MILRLLKFFLICITMMQMSCFIEIIGDKPIFKKKKKRKKILQEKVVAEKNIDDFIYGKGLDRDPFRPYFIDLRSADITKTKKKPGIERYALHTYKLTAILSGTSKPRALLEDVHGDAYVLKVGDLMGEEGGYIKYISPKGITVVQVITDLVNNKKIKKEIKIWLPKDEFNKIDSFRRKQ